jgi:hypothetical protein
MLEFHNVDLSKIIIHRVGNKSLDEGYKLSDNVLALKPHDELTGILTGYFLRPFENVPLYNLTHISSLELNEIYTIATRIFNSPRDFVK